MKGKQLAIPTNRHNERWTSQDVKHLQMLYDQGVHDNQIASIMGRTAGAVAWKRCSLGIVRKSIKPKAPKPGAKYVRYMKPRRSFSLLWGLIKFES